MNKKNDTVKVPLPVTNDREAWCVYWKQMKQEWRKEPEIDAQSQEYLQERLALSPDISAGIYPLKDLLFKLKRAHIEWILAYLGPINYWDDPRQRKKLGPDFRGADLRGVNLSKLPLSRVRFGMTWDEWGSATLQQQEWAAAHLEGANLWGANMEGSRCFKAHFEGAILAYAHIQEAQFRECHLEAADLHSIEVDKTDFKDVIIADRRGHGPRVADIEWSDTKLAQMPWPTVRVLGDEVYAREAKQAGKPSGEIKEIYEQAVRAHEQVANALQGKGIDANLFRYRGKVLQRRLLWQQRAWLRWLGSMILALVAGYGYRLWRIALTYGLTLLLWTFLYAVSGTHLSMSDAMLAAATGRGLPTDASSLAWIVQGCESMVNSYFLGPLITTMVILRILGK